MVGVAAVALVAATFAPAYGLFRFHDDWTFVYKAAEALRTHTVWRFVSHPLEQHWSPLWHALEVLNFVAAGWESDWFVRSVIAASTLGALLVCASLLGALDVSMPARLFGVAVLALHHAAAAARFSFDTYSQSLADLANWSAVAIVVRALVDTRGVTNRTIASVLALLVPTLLLKEQALSGYLAIGAAIVAAAAWRTELRRPSAAWALLAILGAWAAAFALVRGAMGVHFAQDGAFSVCVRCVPVNIAELGAAVMLPVRTLVALDAARSAPPAIGRLAAVGSATACVAAAVAAGNVVRARGGRDAARALALVVCAAAASFFPVALLFHVGELYAHTALFWFAVLAAFAVDGLWIALRRARAAVLVCAAAYLVGIAAGQRANLSEMRATGERARAWLARIDDRLRPVPDGGFVLIAASGEYKAPFDYGLYRVTTPQVLVLTGLSPYPVRAAMRDRVAVYLDFADPGLWRAALERAGARGAYRLEIAGGDARLSRWLAAEVAAGR